MSEQGERSGPRRRPWAWCVDHPLLVVAIGSGLVALGQGIWIWTHRHLGAIDPDEAGYLATALRFHRLIGSDPLAMPRAVGGTGYGPLVPLLSVPLLWLGPDDPRTAMLLLPLLMVVTSMAGAGIARRLAGPRAAMVAGLLFGTFPTVVFATQTYWFGLGAAAFLALAIWALLASDRLTDGRAYAYGACIGAMLLARTMTLGYIPAALVAGVVIAGRDRRAWIGLAKAVGVAAVVAVPWYVAARHAVFDYLFSYGYGKRAGLFGQGGPMARFETRLQRFHDGLGLAWPLGLAAVVAAGLCMAWHRWRGRTDRPEQQDRPVWPPGARDGVAVAAACALGLAALTSTTNDGVWFELPLVALLVPLVVAIAARLPRLVLVPMVAVVAATGVLQLGCSWWLISPTAKGVPLVASSQRSAQYEFGFAEYDGRFRPEHRSRLRQAAGDWARLSSEVERRLHHLTGGGRAAITVSGNFELFNSNTIQLQGEIRRWTPRVRVPDTVTDRAGRAGDLTPTFPGGRDGRPVERILVIALHHQHLFTPDADVRAFYRDARAAGWHTDSRFAIPLGGEVLILRHR